MGKEREGGTGQRPGQNGRSLSSVFIDSQRALKRVAARYFSRQQDIDDIVQEVFLRACHAESKTQVEAPRAYLFKITRNLCLRQIEQLSRHPTVPLPDYGNDGGAMESSELAPLASHEAPMEVLLDRQAMITAFCKVITELPPQCQRAFLMRKVLGFSHKEIAAEMDISINTVEKHVASGLLKCSSYLRRLGHAPDTSRRDKPAGSGKPRAAEY